MWTIKVEDRARKDLRKLDAAVQKRIIAYLHMRVANVKDPRVFCQRLTGNKAGLWRFRVGDYRVVCKFEDHVLIIFVVTVGHRREVYDV